MKFPKIHALVPAGEHFDESAIVNEGGYLSINHLNAIELSLAGADTADATAAENNTGLQAKVDSFQKVFDTLTSTIAERDQTISANAARIQELEAEIVELGKEPSGTGSTVNTPKDEEVVDKSKSDRISLNSDEHPLNKAADRRLQRKK